MIYQGWKRSMATLPQTDWYSSAGERRAVLGVDNPYADTLDKRINGKTIGRRGKTNLDESETGQVSDDQLNLVGNTTICI